MDALVADYLRRFSEIAGPLINCAPILNWFELDARGSRLLGGDESDINTPAVAAALVGKRYVAQASDEISLEVSWETGVYWGTGRYSLRQWHRYGDGSLS